MAIAFQQQTTKTQTSTSNMSSLTLAAGENCLVLSLGWNGTTGTITPSDNNGGTWTEVTGLPVRSASGGGVNSADLWYSVNHPSGATVVTLTQVGGNSTGANLSTYSGVATSSPVDTQNSSTSASTTSPQTGTVTTTNAADLLVGTVNNDFETGGTSPTDYGASGGSVNNLTEAHPGAGGFIDSGYQIVAATGTYGFQWTYGTARKTTGCIVALKAVAAAVNAGVPRRLRHTIRPLAKVRRQKEKRPANFFFVLVYGVLNRLLKKRRPIFPPIPRLKRPKTRKPAAWNIIGFLFAVTRHRRPRPKRPTPPMPRSLRRRISGGASLLFAPVLRHWRARRRQVVPKPHRTVRRISAFMVWAGVPRRIRRKLLPRGGRPTARPRFRRAASFIWGMVPRLRRQRQPSRPPPVLRRIRSFRLSQQIVAIVLAMVPRRYRRRSVPLTFPMTVTSPPRKRKLRQVIGQFISAALDAIVVWRERGGY